MKVITPDDDEIALGTTEATPTISMIDYSRRVTDDFGTTTVVPRGFSRRLSVRVALPFDNVTAVQDQLAALRATPATWIADDDLKWLQVEGFYKDFSIDLNVPPISFCTLTVEGLAETETVVDAGGDPAPAGRSSSLMLVQPLAITPSTLASVSVPETEWPDWAIGATYFLGSRVIRSHRVFESLKASNIGHDPVLGDGWWLDIGPTNAWAMFDEALGTATTASTQVQAVFNPIAINAVAVLDAVGSTVRVQAPGYDQTAPIGADGKVLFLDLPVTSGAGNLTVTIAGTGEVSVGTLMMGTLVPLGVTEASPTAGITDYSRKETDDFGGVTVVERSWSKKMAVRGLIRTDALDLVANRIAAVRTRPSLWIGDDEVGSLIIYGFFKDFSIERGENVSTLSLSIEGLSKASQLSPAFGGPVYWADIRGPNKPDDNADVTADNISSGFVGQGPGATAANLAAFDPAAASALQSVQQAISNIADDNLISTAEKWPLMEVHRQYTALYSSARATSLSLGTSYPDDPTAAQRTAAQTALDNLNAYLAGLVPSWSDPAVNTPADGPTLRAHFQAAATTVAALMTANISVGAQRAQVDGRIYDMTTGNFLTRAGLITSLGISSGIFGQGWAATQGEAATSNALVPVGTNVLVNSSFQRGLFGWYFSGSPGGSINLNLPGYFGTREVAYLHHAGMMTTSEYADAVTKAEVFGFGDMRRYALPVKPGDQIGCSVLAGHHRSRPELLVVYYDGAGAYVSAAGVFMTGSIVSGGVGGENLGRMSFTHTVPANARYAAIRVRMYGNDEENAFLFFAEPWFGVLGANQTTVPAYSPGPPDFLATLGSTAGTDLFRTDGSTVMSQAEVRTPEGISSGFYGQGALATLNMVGSASISIGAVSGDKLAMGAKGPNLIANPCGADLTTNGWGIVEGGGDHSFVPIQYFAEGRRGFHFWKVSTEVAVAYGARAIPVIPGKRYVWRFTWGSDGGYSSGAWHRINYAAQQPSEGYVTGANRSGITDFLGNGPVPAGGPHKVEYVWTCPADVFWASPAIYNYGGAQHFYLSDFEFVEQHGETNLAPNAVRFGGNVVQSNGTTPVTDATAITSLGISSGIFGQGWGATAPQGALDNSYVNRSANALPNSDQTSVSWYDTGYNPNGATFDPAYHLQLAKAAWGTDSYALAGRTNNVVVHQTNVAPGSVDGSGNNAVAGEYSLRSGDSSTGQFRLSVRPGERIIWSVYLQAHRCSYYVYIAWLDAAGAAIGYSFSTTSGASDGWTNHLGLYTRSTTSGDAPPNTTQAAFFVRKLNTYAGGATNSFFWMAAPMVERAASANQTEPSPYIGGAPGSVRQIGYSGELDADRTGLHTAAGFAGQGAFATQSNINLTNTSYFTHDGRFGADPEHGPSYFPASRIAYDVSSGSNTVQYLRPGEPGSNVTETRVASAVAGQGALATRNSVAYGSGFVTGFGTFAALSQINSGNISTYFANAAIGAAVIANAAIGTAHIDSIDVSKINATKLDALAADVGLLRTRTTGARIEIASNEIRSYHGNNQIAFVLSGEA